MKRAILKVWMVTLVIILFYFNIGIQGTENTKFMNLDQKLLMRGPTIYFDSRDHEEEDKENDDDKDTITNIDKKTSVQPGKKSFFSCCCSDKKETITFKKK